MSLMEDTVIGPVMAIISIVAHIIHTVVWTSCCVRMPSIGIIHLVPEVRVGGLIRHGLGDQAGVDTRCGQTFA